jgi:hypothetical protein
MTMIESETPNGADPRTPGVRWEFKQDSFIERLVTDPSQVPELKPLTGYLGKSHRDGYVRLSLSPALNNYVEIRVTDVTHSESLSAIVAGPQLPRSIVWINADAKLRHTRTMSREVQADFLTGDLANAFLGAPGLENLVSGLAQGLVGSPEAGARTTGNVCKSVAVSLISILSVVATVNSSTTTVTITATA